MAIKIEEKKRIHFLNAVFTAVADLASYGPF